MKFANKPVLSGLVIMLAMVYGCQKSDDTTTTTAVPATVPTVFSNSYKSAVTLSATTTAVTMKSTGVPDHVTPYWGTGHALYEAPYTGQNLNPGMIGTQNYSMTIPANPAEASTKEATSLGPIGMALNGVPIYNDREGGNVPVDAGVLSSFDRAGAHPGPGNTYHYHCNGDFTSVNDAKLIGWLRDGFPIYGRKDTTGVVPANLDANGGHVGVTQDYPNGIYHYHCSNVAYLGSRFFILKSGSYHGTKGTFTF